MAAATKDLSTASVSSILMKGLGLFNSKDVNVVRAEPCQALLELLRASCSGAWHKGGCLRTLTPRLVTDDDVRAPKLADGGAHELLVVRHALAPVANHDLQQPINPSRGSSGAEGRAGAR